MSRSSLGIPASYYFWRTYDQKEIDLVEESGGRLSAFEFKYSKKKAVVPRLWTETYPNSTAQVVTLENVMEILG